MELNQTLIKITLGGNTWILLLLILLSILSIAFIIERWIVFRVWERDSKKLVEETEINLKKKNHEILHLLSEQNTPLSKLVKEAIDKGMDKKTLKEALEKEKIILRFSLEKRLNFLGTLGANAPFIGLLGTVIGIMHAFGELAQKGEGGEYVMAGISEALVATALGLFVAIPSAIFFNVFKKKVSNLISLSDVLIHIFLEYGEKKE